MKIGLNATCFGKISSGAKTRFIGIYGKLIELSPNWEFIIFEPSNYKLRKYFSKFSNVKIIKTIIPTNSRIKKYVYSKLFWLYNAKKYKFDIFENFYLPVTSLNNSINIVTIHDLRYIEKSLYPISHFFFKFCFRFFFSKIDYVFAVSNFTKKKLLYYFKKDIFTIYNAIDNKKYSSLSKQDILKFIKKFKIKNKIILSIGHLESRKNFHNLIIAFSKIKDSVREYNLVIAGNSFKNNKIEENLFFLIKKLKLEKRVKILINLSDKEIKCLYKIANLFVFPSKYEGFGIPIIESLTLGCPILTSDLPVFREICGKIDYFNPEKPELIAKSILKVLKKNEKYKIINSQKKILENFNFEKSAMKIKKIYKIITNK